MKTFWIILNDFLAKIYVNTIMHNCHMNLKQKK